MRIEGEVYEVFNFLRGMTLNPEPTPEPAPKNEWLTVSAAKPARKRRSKGKRKRGSLNAFNVAAQYASGKSTTALGKEHGVSASSIRAAVLRAGGKMRPGTRGKKAGRKRKAA